jgi:death-on-curing protein
MKEPKWLPYEAVLAMHERQLAEHGGVAGFRDEGLLMSALERAQNEFAYSTPDLFDLAAAYAFGIARNHPFNDGNKRTALVASFTFLGLNGYRLKTDQNENATIFMKLAAGEITEEQLAAWFRSNAGRR